jgi:phosphoribosylaminoimidazolecarboxamide formyltransferase/IMP cyclohydrolase
VTAENIDSGKRAIRRALVSVYDKTGLEELARGLHEAGVELVSTGSTAGRIAAAGVPVTKVEELTGFPECLDGRVKTLHPKVHAGILADLRLESHRQQLDELGVAPFDLVVVNLYPFRETVASGASPTSASSRSTSAARRWSAPPPRTTRRSRSSPAPRATPTS